MLWRLSVLELSKRAASANVSERATRAHAISAVAERYKESHLQSTIRHKERGVGGVCILDENLYDFSHLFLLPYCL